MKVSEIFESSTLQGGAYYKPKYNDDLKRQQGSVLDWMDAFGFSKEDIASAMEKVKASPEFKKLQDEGLNYVHKPASEKKGTFTFQVSRKGWKSTVYNGLYMIYANGLIRSGSKSAWSDKVVTSPLKSPKPRIKAGDNVGSLVSIYIGAIKELLAKDKNVVKGK